MKIVLWIPMLQIIQMKNQLNKVCIFFDEIANLYDNNYDINIRSEI